MDEAYFLVQKTTQLRGEVLVCGAKNAVLVIIASLILTEGKSILYNVPDSSDVQTMMNILEELGAHLSYDREKKSLEVDTRSLSKSVISPSMMSKMRASILVMGPLLAKFGHATVAMPGGCELGDRPILLHLKGFKKLGVEIKTEACNLEAFVQAPTKQTVRIIFEYPSVGATENVLMYAVKRPGETYIVNASFEPEVLDLIEVLKKMGADITLIPSIGLRIIGRSYLRPIAHEVIPDRLEAGSLLLATAAVGGEIYLPSVNAYHLDCFLEKLCDMGHHVSIGMNGRGVCLKATHSPTAVSIKTGPYPGFPTDLQAPMMVVQCIAKGKSIIEETVFERRMGHVKELEKMGAKIQLHGSIAHIEGSQKLHGTTVVAGDIRSSFALVLGGLLAEGETKVVGLHHWRRGYAALEKKLKELGASISLYKGSSKK